MQAIWYDDWDVQSTESNKLLVYEYLAEITDLFGISKKELQDYSEAKNNDNRLRTFEFYAKAIPFKRSDFQGVHHMGYAQKA